MRIARAGLTLCAASALSFGIRPSSFGILGAAPLSPEQVARSVQDRDTGRDSRALLRMRLVDRRGRARERGLELSAREGGTEGDRILVRFTYPNDIKGTGFLVWEHPGTDDERFLYLPSLGRVRRISGEETQESFVGTDFTYEDIGGREFDDYTYRFADENATWTSPDGRPLPAYSLESRRKDPRATFPRVITLVIKESFVVVGAEIFNRRDERQKSYTVRKLERVEGIWTVLVSTMADDLSDTRTDLAIEKIDYNIGLTEADFSRRVLERMPNAEGQPPLAGVCRRASARLAEATSAIDGREGGRRPEAGTRPHGQPGR